VLEVKHVAEAALHYAKVTGAANEAHADCLRIITRAEIRMAREIDAAQERGEVATPGQRSNVRTSDISNMADLGAAASLSGANCVMPAREKVDKLNRPDARRLRDLTARVIN
jgi:hypothetical protein